MVNSTQTRNNQKCPVHLGLLCIHYAHGTNPLPGRHHPQSKLEPNHPPPARDSISLR